MEKISVIIPVYKTPKELLNDCIKSILNQTYKNLDIILVDDGSHDISSDICDEYASIDSRIRVIHQDNRGVSSARNSALKIIKGEYLAFVDSDDIIHEDTFRIVIDTFTKNDVQCVVYGWKEEISKNCFLKHNITNDNIVMPAEKIGRGIAQDNLIYGGGYPWNKVWKISALRDKDKNIIMFDESLFAYEDKYWILEVLLNCNSVALLPNILYLYRYNPEGLTKSSSLFEKRIFNGLNAYEKIIILLTKNRYMQLGAIEFYNNFIIEIAYQGYKMRKIYIEHYKRTKQYYYHCLELLSLKHMNGNKNIVKYIIIKLVNWFL